MFILSETLTQANGNTLLNSTGHTISVALRGGQNFTVETISFMLHRSKDAEGIIKVEMLNDNTVIATSELTAAMDVGENSSFVHFQLSSPTVVPAGNYGFKISRQNSVKGTIHVRRYEASSTKLVHILYGSLTALPPAGETEQQLTGFYIKDTISSIKGSKYDVGYANWIFNIPKKDYEYAIPSKLTVRLKRGANTNNNIRYRLLIVNTASSNIGWITKYYQTESLNITTLTDEFADYTLPLHHIGHDKPPQLAIGKGTTYHNIMLVTEGDTIVEGEEYVIITNPHVAHGNYIFGYTHPTKPT